MSALAMSSAATGLVLGVVLGVGIVHAAGQTGVAPEGAGQPSQARLEPPSPRIKVERAVPDAMSSPTLRSAHAALQARDYETAARLYDELARTEPRNIDVLLGLAAIAASREDQEAARVYYLRILRVDPRHAVAQGALLGMFGRADFQTAETRLKALVDREASGFLYHTLGNLYAEQSLWPQAQQAYFQAYHLEPGNGDYAYNLAVGLEHLGQRRLAADYYRRAVALAGRNGAVHFDVARAQERIARLASAER